MNSFTINKSSYSPAGLIIADGSENEDLSRKKLYAVSLMTNFENIEQINFRSHALHAPMTMDFFPAVNVSSRSMTFAVGNSHDLVPGQSQSSSSQ